MLDIVRRAFRLKELRKRVIFTLGVVFVYRLLAHIPISGVDRTELQNLFNGNQILGLLDIFSGGAMSNFSIGFMGVGPYITASIIMQLLTYIVPSLEALHKEGEHGQRTISQYTRLLTFPLAILQSFGLIKILQGQNVLGIFNPQQLAITIIITCTTTILIMWLGELISELGIGNGMSIIITAGILAGIPNQIGKTYSIIAGGGIVDSTKLIGVISFLIIALLTVAFIVAINNAVRRIPISYARRSIGRSSMQRIETYLPIKMNAAGVIPIIFALSVIIFPGIIVKFLQSAKSEWIANSAKYLTNILDPQSITYGVLYFLLVIFFTYFYTAIVFKPDEIAENLQKQSGFVPGVRPGKETASFLSYIISRITLPGAIFLGVIAILPFIIQSITHITTLVIGGTGILIIVSVVLETASQINAFIVTKE